jgi:hypothetical protein
MKLLFDTVLILFTCVWLSGVAVGAYRDFRNGGRLKWLLVIPALLALIGSGGFFAHALSGAGILTLPTSYQWPAGYVSNVVTTADGKYVVPIVPAGRVQIYNPDWSFLNGWNVDALGGDFKVAVDGNGNIEVFTHRGAHHYTFDQAGDLISSATLSEPYDSIPVTGQTLVVPTAFLLWPFSHPFISLAVGMLGLIALSLMKKIVSRANGLQSTSS